MNMIRSLFSNAGPRSTSGRMWWLIYHDVNPGHFGFFSRWSERYLTVRITPEISAYRTGRMRKEKGGRTEACTDSITAYSFRTLSLVHIIWCRGWIYNGYMSSILQRYITIEFWAEYYVLPGADANAYNHVAPYCSRPVLHTQKDGRRMTWGYSEIEPFPKGSFEPTWGS